MKRTIFDCKNFNSIKLSLAEYHSILFHLMLSFWIRKNYTSLKIIIGKAQESPTAMVNMPAILLSLEDVSVMSLDQTLRNAAVKLADGLTTDTEQPE
jgi:hypothetical protein